MSDWRPIETAPKDGKKYLATDGKFFLVLNEPPNHARGRWTKRGKTWYGAAEFGANDMTHWMPLPPAPSQEDR